MNLWSVSVFHDVNLICSFIEKKIIIMNQIKKTSCSTKGL